MFLISEQYVHKKNLSFSFSYFGIKARMKTSEQESKEDALEHFVKSKIDVSEHFGIKAKMKVLEHKKIDVSEHFGIKTKMKVSEQESKEDALEHFIKSKIDVSEHFGIKAKMKVSEHKKNRCIRVFFKKCQNRSKDRCIRAKNGRIRAKFCIRTKFKKIRKKKFKIDYLLPLFDIIKNGLENKILNELWWYIRYQSNCTFIQM